MSADTVTFKTVIASPLDAATANAPTFPGANPQTVPCLLSLPSLTFVQGGNMARINNQGDGL